MSLPISYLCDRYTTNMAKSQGGFITFLVKPVMEIISTFLPIFQPALLNLDRTKESWDSKVEEYEKRLRNPLSPLGR